MLPGRKSIAGVCAASRAEWGVMKSHTCVQIQSCCVFRARSQMSLLQKAVFARTNWHGYPCLFLRYFTQRECTCPEGSIGTPVFSALSIFTGHFMVVSVNRSTEDFTEGFRRR